MPTILDTLSIQTCVVSYGKEASFAGSLANVAIQVTAKALGVNQLRLVWAATGDIFSSFTDSTVGGNGTPGIIVLPQTGQDGFRHGTTTFKDWYYEAAVTATTSDGQQLSRTYRFQIPAGQTTLDLDMLDEDGIVTAMPAIAPVATVTSVNGQTGAVTIAGGTGGATIDDTTTSSSKVWSSAQVAATYVARTKPVQATRYRTTIDGANHMTASTVAFGPVTQTASPIIVAPSERYQEFLGFGAALTDSSAYVLSQMTATDRTAILTELFSPQARNWSAVRIAFGTADFYAQSPYTYADNGGTADPNLTSFSIAPDQNYIIPILQQILTINPNVRVFASVWNWPAWMSYPTPKPLGLTATGATTGGALNTGSYVYKVTALFESENMTRSSDPATGTVASGTTGKVTCTWTAVTGAVGYNVYRNGVLIASVPTNSFTDLGHTTPTGLTAATASGTSLTAGTYYYTVQAVNAAGAVSGASTEASVVLASASNVLLTWTPVAGATGYIIGRGTTTGGQSTFYAAGTGAVYLDQNTSPGLLTPPTTESITSYPNFNYAYFNAAANYLVKAIQAYQAVGIPIFAVSPQNEANVVWSRAQMAFFIGQFLGPAITKTSLTTRVLAVDDSWQGTQEIGLASISVQAAEFLLADQLAAPFVDGIAWHGYLGKPLMQDYMRRIYPDAEQYFTEIRNMLADNNGNGVIATQTGNIAENIVIASVRHGAKAAMMWNLALDENGLPNNGIATGRQGVITVNSATKAVTRNPEYWALSHVSSFLRQGARRCASTSYAEPGGYDVVGGAVESVAFVNSDGTVVCFVYNAQNSTQTVQVCDASSGQGFTVTVGAFEMNTFVWQGQL